MAPREDLIVSAVSFLQDPSVANAPLDKRIAFLQSKNLTQEEIDISLARAGDDVNSVTTTTTTTAQSQPAAAQQNYAYRRQAPPPPPPGYPYQGQYWQQQPPPELPRRDWRDWFIMATVMGGVTYGLYFTAKRYIMPLIAPPTPPQLEQDKASIDESFNRAFTLIEQLSTDTAALKSAEEARTTRLDNALSELESVLASLKESDRRRDDDVRRTTDDVRNLKDLIPKAMDAQKENTALKLTELGTELKSLKTLIGNRLGQGTKTPDGGRTLGSSMGVGANMFGSQGTVAVNGASTPTQSYTGGSGAVGGASTSSTTVATETQTGEDKTNAASSSAPDRPQGASAYSRFSNGTPAIPAWQLAAMKKEEKKDTSESGTVTEASS